MATGDRTQAMGPEAICWTGLLSTKTVAACGASNDASVTTGVPKLAWTLARKYQSIWAGHLLAQIHQRIGRKLLEARYLGVRV